MNPKDVTNRPRDRRLEERQKRTARQKWGQRRFQLSDGALTAVAIIMGLAAMYPGCGRDEQNTTARVH